MRRAHPPDHRILQAAAALTWLVVGVPVALRLHASGVDRPGALAPAAAWLAFGVGFWGFERWATTRARGLAALALQTASALVIAYAGRGRGVEVALFVMVAAQTPAVMPARAAFVWCLAQTIAVTLPWFQAKPLEAAIAAGAYLGFQAFALGAVYVAQSESRAREELARVNAELQAAQALLAESSRLAERVRISRELHDSLGHHLTALALNLEVAAHVAEGRAAEHVATARSLTKLLLAEVREVVSAVREEATLDLGQAVRALADGIPAPRIHVSLPDDAGGAVTDPEQARAVFRCVQEIVTNAVRHAGARNLWIEIGRGPEGLRVHAHDDGHGVAEVRPGNGLRGMRERLEQAGGRLEIASRPGRGFELTAVVPASGAPS